MKPTDMKKTFEIFKMFLVRDHGFTLTEATWEVNFFESLGVEWGMKETELKDLYFHVLRRGSKKRLNRKDKRWIIITLGNAMNHACFCE